VTPIRRWTFKTKRNADYISKLEEQDRGASEEIRITAGGFAAS
jgi:hypothetical protein